VIGDDRRRGGLFPFTPWPAVVDAVTLVLATFVLVAIAALVAQRDLVARLRAHERELASLREEKARVEARLAALAAAGSIEVLDGRVIVQGEVLFDSGSPDLRAEGALVLARLAPPLAELLAAEPDQMLMVGGHTDDRPIHGGRFRSNWELSTARAVAVLDALAAAGVPPSRMVASGFGEHHPRAPNALEDGRRLNRRIELLVVPIRGVTGR
jgi:flagellar motor protein MotB